MVQRFDTDFIFLNTLSKEIPAINHVKSNRFIGTVQGALNKYFRMVLFTMFTSLMTLEEFPEMHYL